MSRLELQDVRASAMAMMGVEEENRLQYLQELLCDLGRERTRQGH